MDKYQGRQKMDYSFLIGKILTTCGTKANYAKEIGISKQAMSVKLSGGSSFSQAMIAKSIQVLDLNPDDVVRCFFTPKVEKNSIKEAE